MQEEIMTGIRPAFRCWAGVRQLLAYALIIGLQATVVTDASAVLRSPLTNAEMKALSAADLGRLRWLQQQQNNVIAKKNEDLQTSIANVAKWHDCIQLGVDALSLGLDLKAGVDLEKLSKTRSRYAEATTYLERDGWFNHLVGSGYKEMADGKRRQTYMFAFGMLLDLLGTKKLSCFGGDNTALTATLNATGAQETAEALKKVMENPQDSAFNFFINTLLTVAIDSLKGVEVVPDTLDFADRANSPVFLKLFKKPFSALKVAPPKWDFFLTKGMQITNDLYFAGVLASERKEAESNRVAFQFLNAFFGSYRGNLEQFCLDIAYGPNCAQGTIEQIFYAYLNTPESNGISASSQYNSFTVKDRLIVGVDLFDGLSEQTALARIHNVILQGPLVFDIKITRIPDGVILNDTNLTNGTRSFSLQASLNPLITRSYTPLVVGADPTGITIDCKLNFGTAALRDCSAGIDRPGQVSMTMNVALKRGSQSFSPVQVPLNFPVVAAAADLSAPYWTEDAMPSVEQSEKGNFKARYTIREPRFFHNPSGQLYALGVGDTYWAWVTRGDTLVTPDIVAPDLVGSLPMEFLISPEDRSSASAFTAHLAASSRYADGYLPEANNLIPMDRASLATLENATPYLRVVHPDLVAAAYDSADRSFAVKSGDILQFLPGNDSRFADFKLFTGDAYVVFICKDSQNNAFCSGAWSSKLQGQLQANGALQVIAPAAGRIVVPAVFWAGILNGQAADKIVLDYSWAKLDEQTVAPPSGGGAGTIVPSRPLNDTGITGFANDSQNNLTSEPATHPGQDARYGRDAQAGAGKLTKIGGGGKGFDYSKIANDGSVLPESALLGAGAQDWACTRDNVTGLIWEVKTTSGLRSQSHTYSWYDSNAEVVGTASGGACATSGRCDSEKFTVDVNASGLCGASDWRMPKMIELLSIVDYGRTPAIDVAYFPNTPSLRFLSYMPIARSVWFDSGGVGLGTQATGSYFLVRLVRDICTEQQQWQGGRCVGPDLAPTASNVSIGGVNQVGQTLIGSYNYADGNRDPQGASTFRWLRNGVAIPGATASTYTLVSADLGSTITFEVTPVSTVAPTTGVPVVSIPYGYVIQGGLTWMPVSFYATWENANSYCGNTTINGQTGWRMPTKNELLWLYNTGALNGRGWTLGGTWSSTAGAGQTHAMVNLNASMWNEIYNGSNLYVSCVR